MTRIKSHPDPGHTMESRTGIPCGITNKKTIMEAYTCCQSCGMPIDRPELMGTEKDHSKSTIYCIYCYRDGEFYQPDMTIEQMKQHVREELRKSRASETVIATAVNHLPHLSRWMGIPAIHHCCEWH
jgi:hypothetical protein